MLTPVPSSSRRVLSPYDGPRCPRCDAKLTSDWIRSGVINCPDCRGNFEATAFSAPAPKLRVAEIATAGPASANACANHARNVATTSCSRCGLFICALCDMNVGTGSFCPSCFARMREEGKVPGAKKTRDYASMARVSAVAGILAVFIFVGPLFGVLSMVYNHRARKARLTADEHPGWTAGMIVVQILALIVLAAGLAYDGFLIYAIVHKGT